MGDDLTTFIVPKVEKIRSLNLPDPQGLAQACSGKTLPYISSSSSSSVICQTTGPQPLLKRFLHLMRSRASSFKWEYPLVSPSISHTWYLSFWKSDNVIVFPFAFHIAVQQPFKPLWSRLLLYELEPSRASCALCFKSLLMTLLPASVSGVSLRLTPTLWPVQPGRPCH
jgi:hypothetical protein